MRPDPEGPYVRYVDHVDALAKIEASVIHERAVMRTGPLDTTYERQRAEIVRLNAENEVLRTKVTSYARALKAASREPPSAR
jgi:hypothetical protein